MVLRHLIMPEIKEASKINGVMSKNTRAKSKKLSMTKTMTLYISENNYDNICNCNDSVKIIESEQRKAEGRERNTTIEIHSSPLEAVIKATFYFKRWK